MWQGARSAAVFVAGDPVQGIRLVHHRLFAEGEVGLVVNAIRRENGRQRQDRDHQRQRRRWREERQRWREERYREDPGVLDYRVEVERLVSVSRYLRNGSA